MRSLTALAMFVCLCSVGLYAGTQTNSQRLQELHAKAADAVRRGDLANAIALLTECRAVAATPLEIGIMSSELGATLLRANQLTEAKKWLEQAQEIWISSHEGFYRYAETTVMLAEAERYLGQYRDAERLLRLVLARAPSASKATHDEIEVHALALDDLADMMREEGRSNESRQLLSVATGLPSVSWRRQLDTTIGLAELDRDRHNWEESAAEWNHIADIGREHNEPAVEAMADRGLGETWLARGDSARAEPLLRKALHAFELDEAANARQIASTLTSMAQLYMEDNRLAMAEDALNKALRENEKTLGEQHPQVAIVLEQLADTRSRENHPDLARQDLDRAIRILSGAFGEKSAACAAAFATLAMVEQRAHNLVRAAEIYEQALANFTNTGPEVANFKLTVMRRYADVLRATHRRHEAGAVLAEIKAFRAQ